MHLNSGGLKPDRAIAAEILKAVEGNAIEAALEVAARVAEQQRQRHRALSLELEQARYEAQLAARAVDPDDRLVLPSWRRVGMPPYELPERSSTGYATTNFPRVPHASRTKKHSAGWRKIFLPFGTQREQTCD